MANHRHCDIAIVFSPIIAFSSPHFLLPNRLSAHPNIMLTGFRFHTLYFLDTPLFSSSATDAHRLLEIPTVSSKRLKNAHSMAIGVSTCRTFDEAN